jgi:hypothetical protein
MTISNRAAVQSAMKVRHSQIAWLIYPFRVAQKRLGKSWVHAGSRSPSSKRVCRRFAVALCSCRSYRRDGSKMQETPIPNSRGIVMHRALVILLRALGCGARYTLHLAWVVARLAIYSVLSVLEPFIVRGLLVVTLLSLASCGFYWLLAPRVHFPMLFVLSMAFLSAVLIPVYHAIMQLLVPDPADVSRGSVPRSNVYARGRDRERLHGNQL